MKKHILIVFLALATAVSANAGKVVTDSLYSQVLSSTVKFNVYLPDGFDRPENAQKTYPVIYLLHGLTDRYYIWEKWGRMSLVADELMRCGECREAVIFMPNAGGPLNEEVWNGYFNMPGWHYEDFFFQEFIPQVEKRYRCISDKGHRAIMGLSMGGGGSAVYCQKHPDMFSSCYIMSGWLDNEDNEVGTPDDPNYRFALVCKSVRDNSALDFVRNASEQTAAELDTVKWMIDCGDDDYLLHLSVQMHFLMKEAGINSELRVRNGIHNWEYWHQALRLALPFASRNFEK